MATKPPYAVTGHGTKVTVGSTTYSITDNSVSTKLPDPVANRMAQWTSKNYPDHAGAARAWLNPSLRQYTDKLSVMGEYAFDVDSYYLGHGDKPDPLGPQNDPVGTAAGKGISAVTGTFSSISDAITSLVSALFSSAFWIRAGEVIIGVVLIGVGMVKLAVPGATKLSNVPLYGKMMPR